MSGKERAVVTVEFSLEEPMLAAANDFFEKLGVPMDMACGVFVRQAVREQRIPFEISLATNRCPLLSSEAEEGGASH